MATVGSDNASDEIINTKCCVCAGKNITREAEKYCVDCQDYYCIPCTDTHKTFPMMKGHKLLDKTAFGTTSLQASLPSFPTEKCLVHKAKVLELYCKKHDEVICHTCVALHHRTCQDIHSIPDEVDNLYKQPASAETTKKLTDAKKAMKDIKKDKEHLLSELKIHRQKATESIKTFSQEMQAELKKMETEALRQVEAEFNRIESGLQKVIKEAEEATTDLDHSASTLQRSDGNKAQEFVCVKKSVKDIEKVTESIQLLDQPIDVKICFLPDLKIKNCLKEWKTLGNVFLEKSTPEVRSTVYTVKQERDVNIKLKGDKSHYWIHGSCYTTDGTLLLADIVSKKLKHLHTSTDTIQDHLDLEAGPIAICLTSKHEAAVSLQNRTIQFVSLGDKMRTTRKLKMDHHCCGLAYNDGKLFISDEGSSLYIYNMTGTMLNKITTDKSGNSIFSSSKHVSLSTNRDRVYVADCHKGLVTLDTQGNHLSTFTDPDLVRPNGVCIDGRGNIIVCGSTSSNIVQICERIQTKLGVLPTVTSPLSVCFDPNLKKLAVTNHSSNTVRVYELQ